jgi:CHAT domain
MMVSRRVLLVLPERLRRQGLEGLLRDTVVSALPGSDGTSPSFATAVSQLDADELFKLGLQVDLIVVHLDIPPDSKSCPDETSDRGLEFLKVLKARGVDVPSILLVDSISGRLLSKARDLLRCELVETGVGLEEDLGKAIEKVLEEQGPSSDGKKPICTATVEITIDRDLIAYTVRCRGSQQYYYLGRRNVESGRFERLARDTKRIEQIHTYPDWVDALRDVGGDLTELLIRSDGDFGMHLGIARGMARDENLRIRFSIDRDIHPVALEALVKPEARDQFWMLEIPVSRKLKTPAWRLPLFQDEETRRGPLNCLIIESDVGGYVPEMKSLPALKHVSAECAWLEGFLKETNGSNRRARFGRVERISRATINGTSFKQRVRELLSDGTEWHVVHYGGHSYYDDRKKTGYIFFPGGNGIEPLDITDFVAWLKAARASFVFLSSCQSSHDAFAFELARKEVPAILGFRWEIDDHAAKEHTKTFYTELLNGDPSLELAFQKTRSRMYETSKENMIWAAPMMILQITD